MFSSKLFTAVAGFVLLAAAGAFFSAPVQGDESEEDGWIQLFNGRDLEGWDVWLGKPRGQKKPIGLNNDTKKVFTVVEMDGNPAIRISGEVPGAITSKKEFEDYHLRVEFKWGEKNWRENFPRDGGLLFHCVGPHGVQGGAWMESLECEVMAGHCGDYYGVYGPTADITVAPEMKKLSYYRDRAFNVYQKGGKNTIVRKGNRVLIGKDYEKPHGEWNTIDYLTVGGTSVYLVNGHITMVVKNARRTVDGKEVPLTRGKLQVISEWSELYYRTIALRPLKDIPEQYFR